MNNVTSILNTYICGKNYSFDFNALWTFCLALITILLVFLTGMLWRVSRNQLGGINKTAQADFAHRCMLNFFNPLTRKLFMLIDNNLLIFKTELLKPEGEIAWFEIDQTKLDENPIFSSFIKNPQKKYSAHDIDDLLLGPLDDIGTYHKEKLMDIKIADSFFRYYITRVYRNQQIRDYLEWHDNQPDCKDVYKGLEHICKVLKVSK